MDAERKTRTVMLTDIKGYSAMMAADESLALILLGEHNALVDPAIERRGGRIVKRTGDGTLSLFESAADAVFAALDAQSALHARNAASENPIVIRIGIHVGDVVLRDGDVFGDGVNVAARLEPLADAGGICVSQTVHDIVRSRSEIRMESMGERSLKNIPAPVSVYRVLVPGATVGTIRAPSRAVSSSLGRWLALAALAGGAAAVAVVGWRATVAAPTMAPGTADGGSPAESLRAAFATRGGEFKLLLAPFATVGCNPETALAFDMRARAHLRGIPGLRLLDRRPGDEAAILASASEAGADAVVTGSVGMLGGSVMVNLERHDPVTGQVMSRAYREREGLDAVVADLDATLLEVLTTDSIGARREAVRAVIKQRFGEISCCGDEAKNRNKELTGRVELYWLIEPSGRTSDVRVTLDSVGDPELAGCLVSHAKGWLFPASVEEVPVTQPIDFRRAGETPSE